MTQELLRKFKNHLIKEGKTNATIIAYTKDIKDLLEFCENKDITSELILKFAKRLKDEKLYSNKTLNRKLNSLSKFSRYLIRQNLIKENPIKGLAYPKYVSSEKIALTKSNIVKLVNLAKNDLQVYSIINLILYAGLQISEVSALKVSDVVLANTQPHITISGNSARKIPLSDKLFFVLQDYLKKTQNSHYLFATKNHKKINVRNIRQSIDNIGKKAGIKISPSILRNTFIINQLNFGVNLEFVAKICGHKTLETTKKYLKYTSFNDTNLLTEEQIFDY